MRQIHSDVSHNDAVYVKFCVFSYPVMLLNSLIIVVVTGSTGSSMKASYIYSDKVENDLTPFQYRQ